ncbi:M28 family peptidase [Massilia sp. MS-15]|uniref:M28 family peptidase n=1 Tax=Massilia sp. MS-15 TaxID=2878200 RepID=UPI001CD25061|nr:M28 family peptidase [Massilia sp. MS-15]MCA1245390.1 M28 family peptidase [Massilia sp. MS-15]
MRKFVRSHWKVLIAILLAIALATLTLETDSASRAPDLSARLRTHVEAVAAREHDAAARHIAATLASHGYRLRRHEDETGGHQVRKIEVSVSNAAPGVKPERIFIVGARYVPASRDPGGTGDNASGTAAVLELARLLKAMRPSRGTEVKFVFFVDGKASDVVPGATASANFIAYVGTLASSAPVRQALAAFQAQPGHPAEGLAAPAHVMGVTLSNHAAYRQQGAPALMITDTAFLRYPYYHTAQDARDPPDRRDYAAMARVLEGLARTIGSLAGAANT